MPGRWRSSASYSALVGFGMGLVVASDGSPLWRVVRLLAVAIVCVAVARSPAIRNLRAVALVALGAIAAPVGATIGFSYLTTTGLSAKAMGGVVAFAGGAAALVTGASTLIRSARGWHRLLAIPIALVLGYVAADSLFVAVYATNVPRPSLGRDTPADRGLTYEDVTFVTSDEVTLSGWYVPSRNRAAIVLVHGSSSTRSNVLEHAVVLAQQGYGVLLFDARGHGRSGGRAMDLGWYGDHDISAAVNYLEGRSDVDRERIGALGLSMGGEEALGAMASDPRVRATVAEGAVNRVFADKAWLPSAFGVRGRLQQGVDWIKYQLTDLLTAASPPIPVRDAVVAAWPRPVLLIAAGAVDDERLADEAIQRASPSNVELWVVPGTGHIGGLLSRPHEWTERVSTFFARNLLGTPAGS